MSISFLKLSCLALLLAPITFTQELTADLCGQGSFYNSTTVPYAFNNNAWGNDSSGTQCLQVLDGGSSWKVDYVWLGHGDLVKSYPYMKVHPDRLPVQLWNVSRLDFKAHWSINVKSNPISSTEPAALDASYEKIGLRCNVAIDMFLSDRIDNSTGLGAPIEVMIWPWYVSSIYPLGWQPGQSTPDIDKVAIDGVYFHLYHGYNDRQQHVFSWLAEKNLTSTNADYGPLLKYIWQKGLLSGALYLGQLEFGTEIMFAGQEVEFAASNYNLQIIRQGDPEDTITTSSTAAPTATSTSSPASVSASATAHTTSSSGAGVVWHGRPPESALFGILVGLAGFVLRL